MNNSYFAIESVSLTVEESTDLTGMLSEREGELVAIIDAIQTIQKTKAWSTLKDKLFDGLVETLNVQLSSEAKKDVPDTLKLNRLAGQLKWAEKYADLKKLEEMFRTDLSNIRRKLYGKT